MVNGRQSTPTLVAAIVPGLLCAVADRAVRAAGMARVLALCAAAGRIHPCWKRACQIRGPDPVARPLTDTGVLTS